MREAMGEVSGGLTGWAVITVQHSTAAGTLVFIYTFPCVLLRHYWIITLVYFPCLPKLTLQKLCKDIGKEVDTVFDPNTQRFGSSLEVGHTWKRFQTASVVPALRWGHLLGSVASLNAMVREGELQKYRKTKSICTFQQFGNASEGR